MAQSLKGPSIVSVSSLAASACPGASAGGRAATEYRDDGRRRGWCHAHPDALAGGGYQLSKEAIILYTMRETTAPLGARGIRINYGRGSPGRNVDRCGTAYGQAFLDDIPKPLGRVAGPAEQASVLLFLNSHAAS